MKTKAIQLTIVLMMISATIFAQNTTKSDVQTSMILRGEDKVELRLIKPATEQVVLNVYDEGRTKVYSRFFDKETNLLISHYITEFPNGVYTYEVKNGKELVSATQIVKSSGKDLVYKPIEGIAEAK